jgi:hypothetical protein
MQGCHLEFIALVFLREILRFDDDVIVHVNFEY